MPSIIGQGAIEATFFWQVVLGFCRWFLKVSLHLPSLRPFPSHHLVFLIFTFLSLFFPVSTSTIFLVTTFPNLNPFYSPHFFSVSTFPQCPLFMCLVLPFLTLSLFSVLPYLLPRMKCSFEWMRYWANSPAASVVWLNKISPLSIFFPCLFSSYPCSPRCPLFLHVTTNLLI